jgi:molecular chaperone GrpE
MAKRSPKSSAPSAKAPSKATAAKSDQVAKPAPAAEPGGMGAASTSPESAAVVAPPDAPPVSVHAALEPAILAPGAEPEPLAPAAVVNAPAPAAESLALDVRHAELAELGTCLEVREKALRSFELALAEQLTELERRTRELHEREQVVAEREDDVSIREAAVDEAMSLEREFAPVAAPPPAPTGRPQASASHDDTTFLEGPAEGPDTLLEGPGEVLEMAAPVVPSAELIEAEVKKALLRVRDMQQKKLSEETEALLGLIRSLPFLNFVEPRIRKAQAESQIDVDNTLGFYNLSVRLLREEYDKIIALGRRLEEAYRDKDKALTDAQAALDSLRDDFERFRARLKNEQEGMSARANESLLHKIVPVVDNFDRALRASAQASSVESVLAGVQMIYRMFDDVLIQGGLVPIRADLGTPFEPKTQEASVVVETDEYPEDSICEVVQRGYLLGGKVFRPAMVKVARPVSPGYRAVPDPLAQMPPQA